MLSKALRSRATARLAVAGLALGLLLLVGLVLWSTRAADRENARLNQINEVAAAWGRLFEKLNAQDTAMTEYVQAGDDVGRRPLESAIGLSADELRWLSEHSEPTRAAEVVRVTETYDSYVTTLTRMVELGHRGDYRDAAARAKVASLIADSLRQQVIANIASQRLETTARLHDARTFNRHLRLVEFTVFGLELVLLLLCSAILLSHQRRIERQAMENGYQAAHDALTGLPNRTLLATRMADALQNASAVGGNVALMLIDLDRFKEVNDTMGHHYGDLLLQVVARRLQQAVRDGDTVARLGGDEFAVLMPHTEDAEQADHVATRILATLCQPAEVAERLVVVAGSIGISTYPSQSADATQLLQHADIAMYTAKQRRLGTAHYGLHEQQVFDELLQRDAAPGQRAYSPNG